MKALEDIAPGLMDQPRLGITESPTPLREMTELGEKWNIPSLYVKNDGLVAKPYGGNKARKLDFLLADAIEKDYSDVITYGGTGSNHVLATAVYARRNNLEPHAVQFPQPVTQHVENNLLALTSQSPELMLCRSELAMGLRMYLRRYILNRFSDKYFIPPGGSNPLGVLGFVDAYLELQNQVRNLDPPIHVFIPVGSTGSITGLLVGRHISNQRNEIEIEGIRVIEKFIANKKKIAGLANKTIRSLEKHGLDSNPSEIEPSEIDLNSDYFSGVYGEPTQESNEATEEAMKHEGLQLDPTYTSKTLAAIKTMKEDLGDETVVFWNTLNQHSHKDITREDAFESLPVEYQRHLEEKHA